MICDGGGAREQFAEVYTRDAGGDGTETAANFDRRLRFGVEGFVLRGAPTEIEPDDAFLRGRRRRQEAADRDCEQGKDMRAMPWRQLLRKRSLRGCRTTRSGRCIAAIGDVKSGDTHDSSGEPERVG